MFIHWGVYSVIGRHEWARHRFEIPQAAYDRYARSFNPVNFDADAWVALAKNAGARYMVITSKHHDGFSIYRSTVSDYDMRITPYPGDPLKMLAAAAKRQNMRLGFYHSIMDWHHADYVPKREWESPGQKPGGNIDRYIEFMKAQLRELLTGYGDVATIWFDGEWEHSTQEMHADEVFDMIRSLQPNTLINHRIYKREPGNRADYGTPEQFVPATGMQNPSGKPILWESCVTINTDSWGYNKYETEYKTSRDLIRMLIEVVSKGGNLLLNVGPTPDGRIQDEFVTRLNAMGRWMKVNGEAIYGTAASPFSRLPFFGRATVKGNTLYLHVFESPASGELRVPGLQNLVHSARALAAPAVNLATRRDGGDVIVSWPAASPRDEVATVIALTLDGAPRVGPSAIRPDTKGVLQLGVESAEIETRFGQRAKKENLLGHVYLTHWTRSEDVPSWIITVPKAASYRVEVSYGTMPGGVNTPFSIVSGASRVEGKVEKSSSGELVFQRHAVGEIAPPGRHADAGHEAGNPWRRRAHESGMGPADPGRVVNALRMLAREVVDCERCPRLREYCTRVAADKRRAYRDWDYWGRPVPPFGDPAARVLVIGLAPAAHGGNRTGRMFTGDRSGDFLYRALYETGFASQPESRSRDDGLSLDAVYVTAAVRCAPPGNQPNLDEYRNCRPYLERELDLLNRLQVVVALGRIAFDTYLLILRDRGVIRTRAAFAFGHDREHSIGPGLPVLISSYHPSQQNTSTGKLTAEMLRQVFERARRLIVPGS